MKWILRLLAGCRASRKVVIDYRLNGVTLCSWVVNESDYEDPAIGQVVGHRGEAPLYLMAKWHDPIQQRWLLDVAEGSK